ncbi:unnamed protein product [Aspergillus oryzae]|uniref:Unnamed protein product n=1 Tax=Aspergillus oryzae TaxID=5062 RepID=A0AAN4YWD2_ASPOZ|nr:unnamed protein product [Aspergillus oryzae]GMG38990.1 unnamed protein product [Aspergillus oryzae]
MFESKISGIDKLDETTLWLAFEAAIRKWDGNLRTGTTVSESGETTSSKLKSGYGVGKESDQDEKRKQGTRQKKSNLGYGINDRSWKR